MKNFRKILSVALGCVLALSCLAGCGAGASNYTGENTEFFIGATGPLTGDASSYGISAKNGAELAVEEINAAGGLNGIKFKFDMKDDKATTADAAIGYDTLFESGMQVSLGSVTSASCDSFAAKGLDDNLFILTPSASAANVIADRPNTFRVCFGDPDQGIRAAQELAKNYKNIGAIYDTSDPYSTGVFSAFEEEMKKLNCAFGKQSFDSENKKDFSTQVDALKDCDVIFLPIYYTEAGLIAKACVAKNCKAVLFGCDGLDGIKDQIDAAVLANNKITYITPFYAESTDPTVAKFVEAYKAKYNLIPDQFAADGYDAVMTIYEAMKKAEVTDVTIAPSALCDLLTAVLTDASFSHAGTTGTMTWEASGACVKDLQIVELN